MKFVLSGNLGREAAIEVTSDKITFSLRAKRKFRFNVWFFFNHIRLQYLESNLSNLSLTKILLNRILHDIILFPKEVFHFLFSRYIFELKIDSGLAISPEIKNIYDDKKHWVWVSRQAQIAGVFSIKRDQDIDWDLFRKIESPRGYLLQVTESFSTLRNFTSACKSLLPNLVPTEVFEVSVPQDGHYRIVNLRNATVDRMNLVVQDNIGFPVYKFDYHEKTSRPTSLLFSMDEKNYYYPFDSSSEVQIENLTMIPFSTNWYHMLVEGLSAYLKSKHYLIPAPILLPAESPTNIVDIVKRLSDFEPIFLYPHQRIHVNRLQMVQEWSFKERFNFNERAVEVQFLAATLKELYGPIESHDASDHDGAPHVIFMSRPLGLFRRLSNLDNVLIKLKSVGIQVIEPSKLPLETVARHLLEADILIAETGAALTNVLFCRTDTKVVEIQPKGVDTNFWPSFSKTLGIDHRIIPASKTWMGFGQSHSFPFRKVNKLIDELLK